MCRTCWKFDSTRPYETYNEDFGSRYRSFCGRNLTKMILRWFSPVFEDCSFANSKVTITVSIFTLQQRKIKFSKRSKQTNFVNSLIDILRILTSSRLARAEPRFRLLFIERLSMTFTANSKRQKWNFYRLSSAVCTVEWNNIYLQWIVGEVIPFLCALFAD